MNDFTSLRILDRFRGVFEKLHIDYDVMRKILQLKLTMDSRRIPPIFSKAKPKKEGNQFLKSLWMYGFLGLLFLTPFLFLGNEYLFSLTFMFTALFVILMTSMVSDFSAVLLDTRDKNILYPKPISTKTVNAAKVIHIIIYMILLTGSFIIIPFIISIFRHGVVFALMFLMETILISNLSVVLTAFVYLFILRFFSGEKLKDIINYVQIFLAIGMAISYQLVGRVFEVINIDISYIFAWWHLLLPPIWFAAPFELVLNHNFSWYTIVLSVLAIIVPILSIILYICLMPTFEKSLAKLESDSHRKKKRTRKIEGLWSKVLCKTKDERTFYKFATLMLKEEREIKLKIYPMLGLSIIFPFIFLYNNLRTGTYVELISGNSFMVIYFSLIMIPSVVQMLGYSSHHKGQWVFYIAPITNRSIIYSATLKACIINYFVPILLSVSIIFLWIFSFRIVLDIVVLFLVAIFLTLASYHIYNKNQYPFSSTLEHTQDNSFIKGLVSMILVGVMAGLHALITFLPFGLPIYTIVLLFTNVIGWKISFKNK